MISFVKGILAEKGEDSVVVEAGPVGLEVKVPLSVLNRLPCTGREIILYTYFQVREDGMNLYGFLHPQEREIFRQLLGVNGVGPRAALGILSALCPSDLRTAVLCGDAKTISKAPGVGAKTAQRIIFDLKDKISADPETENWMFEPGTQKEEPAGADLAGAAREALQALVALGYTSSEASRAVKKVTLSEGMNVEDVLKASLKHLAFL